MEPVFNWVGILDSDGPEALESESGVMYEKCLYANE